MRRTSALRTMRQRKWRGQSLLRNVRSASGCEAGSDCWAIHCASAGCCVDGKCNSPEASYGFCAVLSGTDYAETGDREYTNGIG